MKKVLFASTALVAFAGAAAADVTLSGSAEMGITDTDAPGANVEFFTDIDVTFTMSGETDGGLTFGATVDLDENGAFDGALQGDGQGGETIFLSGNFGTITMGDTDGALDWALTEVNFNSGSLADNETGHAGFNGNAGLDGLYDGQIARYDYSFGDFGVALSAEIDDTNGPTNDDVYGIGFRYGVDLGGTTLNLGLGYQTASVGGTDVDTVGFSINAGFGGGFTAGLSYVDYENHVPSIGGGVNAGRVVTPGFDTDHIGVGLGYANGPWAFNINYGEYDSDNGGSADGFGLSVGYDLGGGAIIQFGYGSSDSDGVGAGFAASDLDTYTFGVRMNF